MFEYGGNKKLPFIKSKKSDPQSLSLSNSASIVEIEGYHKTTTKELSKITIRRKSLALLPIKILKKYAFKPGYSESLLLVKRQTTKDTIQW